LKRVIDTYRTLTTTEITTKAELSSGYACNVRTTYGGRDMEYELEVEKDDLVFYPVLIPEGGSKDLTDSIKFKVADGPLFFRVTLDQVLEKFSSSSTSSTASSSSSSAASSSSSS